jgi:hypothetical protein
MKRDKRPREPREVWPRRTDEHVERLLDMALEATFPASDPIAVSGDTRNGQIEQAMGPAARH